MKNLFKSKNQKDSQMSFGINRVGENLDRAQHKWADYLNGKLKNKPSASILVGLVTFCVFFGGSSVLIISMAFNNRADKIDIQKITVPRYVITRDSGNAFFPLAILTNKQYRNIERFKTAMDSLQKTEEGKHTYDSICRARPGLMDSVSYTEQIFLQQSNSK